MVKFAMRFQWDDYCTAYKDEIESWMGDGDTQKCASDGSFQKDYEYYISSPEYTLHETFFCKVIKEKDTGAVLATVILLGGKGYPLTVNPVIVNPALRNKGYCTLIIKDLAENIRALIPGDYDCIQAGIDLENGASIRAFEKCGFSLHSTHPDGDFACFRFAL